MKKAIKMLAVAFVAMGMTFASCNKEEDNTGNNPNNDNNNPGGPASSTIVYTDLSSPVTYSSGEYGFFPGTSAGDFNFAIENNYAILISVYQQGAGVVTTPGADYDQVTLLQESAEIGANSHFTSNYSAELYSDVYPTWNGKTGYIGFKMQKDGATHYGWMKAKVQGYSVTIYGYAYEGAANKAIKAGATK